MRSILVIEPDKPLANALYRKLISMKFNVTLAHNVSSAISEVDLNKPDLVILELQLPINNGIEFLYEMKSYPDMFSIPVIIYSHISEDDIHISSKMISSLGIKGIFSKSIDGITKISNFADDLLSENIKKEVHV